MNKFAATAVLAASASAVEFVAAAEVGVGYEVTIDLLPDVEVAAIMPQGTGRDNTDWSWHFEHMDQWDVMEQRRAEVVAADAGLDGAIVELEVVKSQILSPEVEHQRNCQLHREEEVNLYYQCTQNDINNYALHHFGGEKRSYPRWVEEYNVCIAHIHTAKTLHLDFHHNDGTVTLEPCEPQNLSPSIYIGHEEEVVIVDPVIPTGGVISPDPLNPHMPCDQQNLPNWSGIWVEIWGGEEEANAIYAGEKHHEGTERCYTIMPTEDYSVARLLETWDSPGSRDYALTLRPDSSVVENGCMIHTHLNGTQYTQWVRAVGDAEISMSNQIMEQWHHLEEDGTETYLSSHHEIRIGDCIASEDESYTVEKHYTPGVLQ